MESTHELGPFLRSRRARLTPEDVGLPEYGPRRVPGLRREEVAALAGVSAVYYMRLEQGRAANPSEAVLDALARVLRLDRTERTHLHDLARPPARPAGQPRPGTGPYGVAPRVRPGLLRLLDAVGAVPAYVMGPDMEVLAANRLAIAIILNAAEPAEPAEPAGPTRPAALPGGRLNLARHILLEPVARELYPEWEQVARQTVGYLRFSAGRFGDLPRFAALIAELEAECEEFPALWAERQVRDKTYGTKRFRHRLVGEFELHYETVALPGDEGQALVVLAADAGTPDDTALRLLGSWSAATPTRSADSGAGTA
ncbi:helix-turn-helix transcriptional regulator [Kitasatospora sp. NPDC048540]|uniref:helix-turn-helix transcriptional regulator n=1 Tax=unclassified Kitasatospora TaxID=2633591 RepID=UPI00053A525F|nr:helix-turn-helix transcriptional regulator [Kitasatospora sp. MBT63]